jgi:hypothetical protein
MTVGRRGKGCSMSDDSPVIMTCPNLECPDIELFGVRGEYGDGVTHCPKCGVQLEVKPTPEELNVPKAAGDGASFVDISMPEEGEFFVVAAYRDLSSAYVARSLLWDFGHYVELLDEFTIGLNWMWSQAVGGVKLVAMTNDPDEVADLLDFDGGSQIADLPESALPPTPFDVCPHCGSAEVERPRWSAGTKALGLLFMWLVLFTPVAKHFEPTRCAACGLRWHPQWLV